MAITIKQFGNSDRGLWPLIGPYTTSREVHKALGGGVFSDADTTWWVAFDGDTVVGFCTLRADKNNYWLENSYVIPEARDAGVHTKLSDARLKHMATLPSRTVKVCCRTARWAYYQERGFHQDSVRGDWIYASKLSSPPKDEEAEVKKPAKKKEKAK